jgi:hypothetical protein
MVQRLRLYIISVSGQCPILTSPNEIDLVDHDMILLVGGGVSGGNGLIMLIKKALLWSP